MVARFATSRSSSLLQIIRSCNHRRSTTASQRRGLSTAPTYTRRTSDAWPHRDLQTLPAHLRPAADETLDLILRQKIYLIQARRGYRSNVDSHILANFASSRFTTLTASTIHHYPCNDLLQRGARRPRVLDLGAGSGIVSILFSRAHSPSSLHLLDLQPQLADRALRNLQLNGLLNPSSHPQSVQVHCHDIAGASLPDQLHSAFDVVLCNPPFYLADRTRKLSKNAERRLAHLESSASLSTFLAVASMACDAANPNAFIAMVHDVRERERVYQSVNDNHLAVIASREMCHFATERSTRILLQLQPINTEQQNDTVLSSIEPTLKPIILHPDPQDQGIYSEEIESFFGSLPLPSLRIGRLRDPGKPTLR